MSTYNGLNEAIQTPSNYADDVELSANDLSNAVERAAKEVTETSLTEEPFINKEGSRYQAVRNLTIKDIAKLVREDIKTSIKENRLPKGLKTSVRTDVFAMGQAITITVASFPDDMARIFNIDYLRATRNLTQPPPCGVTISRLCDEVRSILNALRAIANAYNFDESDSHDGYHNSNFYTHVEINDSVEDRALALQCIPRQNL